MKTIRIKLVSLGLILACTVAVAKDEPAVTALKESLGKVPAAEVPAKAADLVAQAKPSNRDAVAADVVTAALKKNPTTAVAIVGAISRKTPEVAATVAATAAGIQPRQASVIAQAAAAAAPTKAGAIVTAVCKAVPSAYREIALAVAKVSPTSAKEILEGLSEAMPALKGVIDQAIASYSGQVLSVGAVLDRVPAPSTPPVVAGTRPPTVQPPFVPLSGTPGNAPPGNNVPPGGRDYASP